jgi:hypothetical protein
MIVPESPAVQYAQPGDSATRSNTVVSRAPSTSLRELGQALGRQRRLVAFIEGSLLLACLLYWLVAPNQYEAAARVELRTAPASSLSLDSSEPVASSSILSAPIALETLAGILRSDELAWRVITSLKLYDAPGFRGSFAGRFPGFHPDSPAPDAQAWLLDRFSRRLTVESLPRSLLVEVRFRSHDAVLSASVVNALSRAGVAPLPPPSPVVPLLQSCPDLGSQLLHASCPPFGRCVDQLLVGFDGMLERKFIRGPLLFTRRNIARRRIKSRHMMRRWNLSPARAPAIPHRHRGRAQAHREPLEFEGGIRERDQQSREQ